MGQALAITLIYFIGGIKITSFYGLGAEVHFNGIICYLLTLITITAIMNSFNLIDGIDGLAGSFSLMALLFFGFWFNFIGEINYAILSFALAGAILAFLFLNWEPSRIFMGDTGSLTIGMVLSIFVIEFMNNNYKLNVKSDFKFNASIGTSVCVLIIPLTDTIRVIILRLYKRVSPFSADKRHIHHALIRLGLSHRLAVSILCGIHILFISMAIFLRELNDISVLTLTITLAIVLCILLDRLIARRFMKILNNKNMRYSLN